MGTLGNRQKHKLIVPAKAFGAAHRAKQKQGKQIFFGQSPRTGTKSVETAAIATLKLLGQHGKCTSKAATRTVLKPRTELPQYIATPTPD